MGEVKDFRVMNKSLDPKNTITICKGRNRGNCFLLPYAFLCVFRIVQLETQPLSSKTWE